AWRNFLSENVCGSNLFNDPEYIEARLVSNPDLVPRIVVVRQGEKIRCVAPFCLQVTRLRLALSVLTLLSLPVRVMTVFGDDFVTATDDQADELLSAAFGAVER